LIVAFDGDDAPGLWTRSVEIGTVSFVGEAIAETSDLLVRVRYRDPSVPARFEPLPGNRAHITFVDPQRALALGQVLAIYDGNQLLGGGIYETITPVVPAETSRSANSA
jgi:tRNA-specific 2-thiouridylase